MNFANQLLEDVFEGNEAENAAELIHDHGHAGVLGAKLPQELAGGLGLRDDEDLAQDAAQIEGRHSHGFLQAALAVEQNPDHVLDVNEAENVVFRTAINRQPRTLRGGEGAHHFIERSFDGEHMHVGPWHHDLAHLHLAQLNGAEDEFFFARRKETPLASLLDLNFQLLRGVGHGVALRRADAQGAHHVTGRAVEKIDDRPKSAQKAVERTRDEERNPFGAGQADGLGHQFAEHHVKHGQQRERESEGGSMCKKGRTSSGDAGPNAKKRGGESDLAKSAEGQGGQRDTHLHAGDDTV